MSDAWEQSPAAQALRGAASQLEVGAPPPLAEVREVARRRAVRAARLMALAIAIPIGAMAAGGAYVWANHQAPPLPRRGEGRGEGAVNVRKEVRVQPPAEPLAAPPVTPAAPAPAPVPAPAVARVVRPAPPSRVAPLTPALSPTGEREVVTTPEIPAAVGGGYAPAPPAQRTTLADEASKLSQALAALRGGHDPARALELLGEYRDRFPSGALRHEAALAAAEAHRALGHTTEALEALEQVPHRPDLDVLRAELNAELGRCEVARAIVAGVRVTGALLERALFTDATCAVTLGAREEAVADLKRLPQSQRARELLEQLQ